MPEDSPIPVSPIAASGADEMDGARKRCHHLIMSSARVEIGPDGSSQKVLPWDTLLMAFKDQIFSCAVRALEFYKNENPEDGTEENFFAELMRPESKAFFTVKSCSTLEPGEDFDHGCLICPPGLLLHPQKGQFLADISSYQPVKWKTR